MCKTDGLISMINIPVWMFLASFDSMRKTLIESSTISNMLHFGRGIFGADFGTVAFSVNKRKITNYIGVYRRLFEKQGAVDSVQKKQQWFFSGLGHYYANQDKFLYIPGTPVAYWISEQALNAFKKGISIDSISDFTGSQHKTANNEKYLRYWWEIKDNEIKSREWIFYIKGGEYRKWYGNIELVVDWNESARNFYITNPTSNMIKEKYWFKEGITYTSLTSSVNGFRYLPAIGVFDIKGPSIVNVKYLKYCLGFFNSKVAMMYIKLLNPTITLQVKDVKNVPLLIDESKFENINPLVANNIKIANEEWDSFETSWDFSRHPLVAPDFHITHNCTISDSFEILEKMCSERFYQLKQNEERLNDIFINIYGLQNEMLPEINEENVTIRKADLARDIRSFVSYAVGCMFGRYSLDEDGLIYAGGEWNINRYTTFIPDEDNCIPITDEEYFSDDIVGRFVEFVKKVYGADILEENLDFIANALGNKGDTSREVIRNYFLKDFYVDHLKVYQKRPIYWLFDSGKQNGFKALIYMHRYDADTVGRVRTDYLHRAQKYVETAMQSAQYTIDNASSASEKSKATKAVTKYTKQLAEMKVYDEAIAHIANKRIEIDLDDGVKVNYEKFQGVEVAQEGKKTLKVDLLAKIK